MVAIEARLCARFDAQAAKGLAAQVAQLTQVVAALSQHLETGAPAAARGEPEANNASEGGKPSAGTTTTTAQPIPVGIFRFFTHNARDDACETHANLGMEALSSSELFDA